MWLNLICVSCWFNKFAHQQFHSSVCLLAPSQCRPLYLSTASRSVLGCVVRLDSDVISVDWPYVHKCHSVCLRGHVLFLAQTSCCCIKLLWVKLHILKLNLYNYQMGMLTRFSLSICWWSLKQCVCGRLLTWYTSHGRMAMSHSELLPRDLWNQHVIAIEITNLSGLLPIAIHTILQKTKRIFGNRKLRTITPHEKGAMTEITQGRVGGKI